MSLVSQLPLDELSPMRLWPRLDPPTRLAAARALYAHDWGEGSERREADLSIARDMRFRERAVRQLPVDRRAHYLARGVQHADSLAQSLLLALHLEHRRPMLARFLDGLDIPNDDGLIPEGRGPEPPAPGALVEAADRLYREFPGAEVDVYLLTLLAMDPGTWGGLAAYLRNR